MKFTAPREWRGQRIKRLRAHGLPPYAATKALGRPSRLRMAETSHASNDYKLFEQLAAAPISQYPIPLMILKAVGEEALPIYGNGLANDYCT